MGKKIFRCVLCGDHYYGYGNNPYPLYKRGRCCDLCDSMFVIPTRISLMGVRDIGTYEAKALKIRRAIKKDLAS